LKEADVVDSLDSTSTTAPLSANQGKVLKDAQDVLNGDVATEGSVLKDIKDTAQDATFTDTSGLDATTLANAINEIYAEKAVANGLASLDATGKIPVSQLPVSAMEFKGGWDASSGAYPVTPDTGDFWTVSVAGTTEGVEFDAGDAIVYNGASWDKINKVEVASEVSYDNSTSGLASTDAQGAIDELDGRVDTAEGDIDNLETLTADHESRLDASELAITQQGQDLASVKQTLQQGNGATLDFSDIGIVPLDARATGRANPTVEGLTARNMVVDSGMNVDSNSDGVADGFTFDGGMTVSVDSVTGQRIESTIASGVGDRHLRQTVYGVVAGDIIDIYIEYKYSNTRNTTANIRVWYYDSLGTLLSNVVRALTVTDVFKSITYRLTAPANTAYIIFSPYLRANVSYDSVGEVYYRKARIINLTSIYGAGNEPTTSDCAKIFSYFDGTKSIQLPARVRSVGKNLFNPEVYSVMNIPTSYDIRENYWSMTAIGGGVGSYHKIKLRAGTLKVTVDTLVRDTGSARLQIYFRDSAFINVVADSSGFFSASTRTMVVTQEEADRIKYILIFIGSGAGTNTITATGLRVEYDTPTPYEPYTDSTLYLADNEEVRSVQAVSDTVSVVNGEHMLTKKISTPVSVASGVAVDVTNYPAAKTGGKFSVELTAGGTQIGIIGTDSTSGAGTLRFELATPLTTPLLTSGILQAKPNGTVYFEPYYEGSHQTNASSEITLPYTGTIDKLTGYDENLEPYEVPSTGYTLVGTTLTITGAEENEVFYVELSRSEPLAPELIVNTLNNDQVTLDSADGKYYQIGFTTTNGVPTVTATEVV
jgi:hypothetical protein